LIYSLDKFRSEFPEFQWDTNIYSGIKKYNENVEISKIVEEEVEDIEEKIFIKLATANQNR
jgi:hypothetical protein